MLGRRGRIAFALLVVPTIASRYGLAQQGVDDQVSYRLEETENLGPRLIIEKRLRKIDPDGTAIFEIEVANHGNAPSRDTLSVREDVSFRDGEYHVSMTSDSWRCIQFGPKISACDRGLGITESPEPLAPGQSTLIEFTVRPLGGASFSIQKNCVDLLQHPYNMITVKPQKIGRSCVDLLCPPDAPSVHYVTVAGRKETGELGKCEELDDSYCGAGKKWFWGICGCGCIDEPGCWAQGAGDAARVEDSSVWRAARRPGEGDGAHLLFTVGISGGEPVEEVRIELPKRTAQAASPSHLPSGWSMERDGGTLLFAGPVTEPPVHLKLDVGGRKAPEKVDFEVRSAGRTAQRVQSEPVAELPPLETSNSLRGIVILPERVSPGDTIQIRPVDPARAPRDGRWTVGGEVLKPMQWQIQCAGKGVAAGMLELRVPFDWQPDELLAVVYENPWGETAIDVPDAGIEVEPFEFEDLNGDGVWSSDEPAEGNGAMPAIEGGSDIAVAGEAACACGAFPDLDARTGLLLDGRRFGAPLSASDSSVWFEVPGDASLGRHRVSGWGGAGFASGAGFDLDVVRVQGELDSEELFRGGSTTMRLRIVGSELPVTFRLRNLTTGIVSLEGGNDQTVTSSGGSENIVRRGVQANQRGDFDIQWELSTCPCADGAAP